MVVLTRGSGTEPKSKGITENYLSSKIYTTNVIKTLSI